MKDYISPEIVAVIIGAALTLIATLIVNRKNYESSLEKEIAKERVSAYKKIYDIVSKLDINLSPLKGIEIPKDCFLREISKENSNVKRKFGFPKIFINKEELIKYQDILSHSLNQSKIYLEQNLFNKVSFLNSYFSEVVNITTDKSDCEIQAIGFVLSNEIEKLCDDIENDIQIFITSNKKSKLKGTKLNAYEYSYNKRTETLLFNYYVKVPNKTFGSFPRCEECIRQSECPLNTVLKEILSKTNENFMVRF